MRITETEETFSFESLFSEATKDLIDDSEKEVDVVTFCEHPFYLDQPLHPVEKLILKVYYGLPLDNKTKSIKIRSFPFDHEGKYLTEKESQKRAHCLRFSAIATSSDDGS